MYEDHGNKMKAIDQNVQSFQEHISGRFPQKRNSKLNPYSLKLKGARVPFFSKRVHGSEIMFLEKARFGHTTFQWFVERVRLNKDGCQCGVPVAVYRGRSLLRLSSAGQSC